MNTINYPFAAVGLLMMVFSAWMIVNPAAWSRAIVSFAEWKHFHIFEIVSRLGVGLLIAFVAGDSKYPAFANVLAGLFIFAGLFLIALGERRHREFAARAAGFTWFRPAGFASLALAAFIIYTSIR